MSAGEEGVETSASIGLPDAFDKVHDGAQIIDPDKCVLALFVLPDGKVHIKSPHNSAQVADMLRQLAARMDLRTNPGDPT